MLQAINSLKNNKSLGTDAYGILGEFLKNRGTTLNHKVHHLILSIWNTEDLPQQLKDARIISIYNMKGDRAACGNSRGISLLSMAGSVLAKIFPARLNSNIVGKVCPDSQCGFRRGCGTIVMVFVARQFQEKSREQNRNMCMALLDLIRAFDTIDCELL